MTNSEARKRKEEAQPDNIVVQVLAGGEAVSLEMSVGESLMAVGDLMSAALQLLGQAIRYMTVKNEDDAS